MLSRNGGATLDEVTPPPGGMTPTLPGRRGGVQAPFVGRGRCQSPFSKGWPWAHLLPVAQPLLWGKAVENKDDKEGPRKRQGIGLQVWALGGNQAGGSHR